MIAPCKALIIARRQALRFSPHPLEHDSRGFGRICSDHETRLRELVTIINAVARKARVQDKLNEHGFAGAEAAIKALQRDIDSINAPSKLTAPQNSPQQNKL